MVIKKLERNKPNTKKKHKCETKQSVLQILFLSLFSLFLLFQFSFADLLAPAIGAGEPAIGAGARAVRRAHPSTMDRARGEDVCVWPRALPEIRPCALRRAGAPLPSEIGGKKRCFFSGVVFICFVFLLLC